MPSVDAAADPYAEAAFPLSNRLRRALWSLAYVFYPAIAKAHVRMGRIVLRVFGARLGAGVCVHASARVWAPWNLECADMVAIGPGAEDTTPRAGSCWARTPFFLKAHTCVERLTGTRYRAPSRIEAHHCRQLRLGVRQGQRDAWRARPRRGDTWTFLCGHSRP